MPLALIDPEDPQFRGRAWLDIEEMLDQREREDLAEHGIELPPGMTKTQLMYPDFADFAGGGSGPKEVSKPWETPVGWGDLKPSCTSKNWRHKDLKFDVGEGIAYLTLNAPDRNNSLNFDVQDAFQDACFELQTRKDIRVVVLKAEGRMFCAGGDPKWFQACAAMSDEDNKKGSLQFAKFLYMFQALPQLTIALVQGSAMGGGVGLASICDVVIAVKNAYFVLSEVRLGVIPATISPYVVAKIGVPNAKRLFCTAENCSAEKAKTMGLVQEVVTTPAEMQEKLVEYITKATMCGPEALAMTKKLVQDCAYQPISQELLSHVGEEAAKVQTGSGAQEAVKALTSKRKPEWAAKEIKP